MGNYTPTPLGSLANQQAAVAAINENLEDIASALSEKLDRVEGLPNQMERDLDMNSNHIVNVADPVSEGDAVNLRTLQAVVGGVGGGEGGAGITNHGALLGLANDDHPQYLNNGRGDARYVRQVSLNGLVTAVINTTRLDELSDVVISSPVVGDVPKWDGTNWVNAPDSGGGGSGNTNLSATRTGTTVTVASDTGTDAVLLSADTTNAGVMTAADKTKLNGIAEGATVNSADATLLSRSNHTGTQLSTTISNFQEAVEDVIGTKVVGGAGVTVTYNDATGNTTIAATGGGGGGATLIDDLVDVDAPVEVRSTQPHLQWDDDSGAYKAVKIPFGALAGVSPFGNFNEVYFGNAPGDVIYWTGTGFINGKAPIPEDVFNGTAITSDGRFVGHIHRITNAGGLSTITLTNDLAANAYLPGNGFWTFQEGTAGITFAAGAGVTIRSPGGALSFNTQWQMIWVHKVSANTWAIVPLSSGTSLTVQEEGSNVVVAPSVFNFVGAGVTATNVSGVATITIPGGGGSVDLAANYAWTGAHTWSRPGPNPSGLTIQQGTDQSKALIYGYRSGVAGNDRSGLIEYQYDNTGGNATVVNYLTLHQRGNLTGGFSATETLFAQADSLNGGAILGSYIVAQSPASAAYGGSGQAWGSGITYAQEINYANRWQDFGFQRDFAAGRWVGGTLYAADCLFGPDGLSPSGVGFHSTYGVIFAPGTNGGVSRGTFTPVYVARDTVPNTGVTVLLRGGTTSGGGFRPDAGVELDLNYTDGIKTTAATFTGKAIAMAVGQRLAWGTHDQTYASAAPTTGTWTLGSIVWNANQGTGEFAGWKCVQAGTPGVWEGFGGRRLRSIGVGVNAVGENTAYDRAVAANTPMAVYSGTGNHIHFGDQTSAWWNVTTSGGTFTINNLVSGGGTPRIDIGAGTAEIKLHGGVGFQGTNPITKPTVTGSRGGNAALASLLTALANYGLITDSTS